MPLVSIIIPCYNEQATIRLLLDAVACQTFLLSEMEVIIADGLSSDHTREVIAEFHQKHPDLSLSVVNNPKRIIPSALNIALSVAKGDTIIRLDAHSIPRNDYVARCVSALAQGLGDNVGGVWQIQAGGSGWMSRSIADAAAHPLGVGDARYRFTSQAGPVDTVPFGAFKRELVERIGAFDETLPTNEDYEFNVRVRQHGGRVWLDPEIRSVYFARSSLRSLAQQYWRYGYWKERMLRRYPATIRWRQALPPLFVVSLVGLLFLSAWFSIARLALSIEVLIYLAALLVASLQIAFRQKDLSLLAGVPLAVITMHFSWASGFLWSLVRR
jgi:glycosyltransferase involved in cell wall biosynthesis